MNYSLHTLTSINDCDALLQFAYHKMNALTIKKTRNEQATEKHLETALEMKSKHDAMIQKISILETIISLIPDSPVKESARKKKAILEHKKFILENRKEKIGTVALLENEIALACLNQDIQETEAFIAALEAKRSQLRA